jgi:hypothetical protein
MISCSQKKTVQQTQVTKEIEPKGIITLDTTYILKLNQSLPFYRVRLVEGEDSTYEIVNYYKIYIQYDLSDSIIQTMIGESPPDVYSSVFAEYPDDIEFIDINFDGFLDIIKVNGVSANGMNKSFAVYLFNHWDKLFYYNEKISTILGGSYYSLNSDDSTIFSAGGTGCLGHCYSQETYKVTGDTLVLIRREHQTRDDNGNPENFIRTEEELVNGVLTIVSQDTVDD